MNHQQLLKHIVRVFPNWYVGMYISWVKLDHSGSQPFNYDKESPKLLIIGGTGSDGTTWLQATQSGTWKEDRGLLPVILMDEQLTM